MSFGTHLLSRVTLYLCLWVERKKREAASFSETSVPVFCLASNLKMEEPS